MGWWPDGRIYEGDFCDGKKHGEGTLTWPDGRSYSGQWCEGKQHGTAIACTAQGLKRSSQWRHGKFVEWIGDVIDKGEQQSPGPAVNDAPFCGDNWRRTSFHERPF